jgi:hypothetical protein
MERLFVCRAELPGSAALPDLQKHENPVEDGQFKGALGSQPTKEVLGSLSAGRRAIGYSCAATTFFSGLLSVQMASPAAMPSMQSMPKKAWRGIFSQKVPRKPDR